MCGHKHPDCLLPPCPKGDVWQSLGAATAINLAVNKFCDAARWYRLAHTRVHTYMCAHAHTILSPPAVHPTVAGCQHPSPLPWGSPFLFSSPLHCQSTALPPLLPPSDSGSCLSMSQHCRCHNSPAGRTAGEEKTGEERRRGVCCSSILDGE